MQFLQPACTSSCREALACLQLQLKLLRRALCNLPLAHNLPDGLLVGGVEPEPCLWLVDRTVVRTPYGPIPGLACHGFNDFIEAIELPHRYEIAVVMEPLISDSWEKLKS